MASYSETDRVLALGGVFQAAVLARDIARSGTCNASVFTSSRETLFNFEPESVEHVFGGVQGVAVGVNTLLLQLQHVRQRDLEISRYVVSLLHLADRLMKSDTSMQGLHSDLVALARRRHHFELGDGVQHEQLSTIYQERISTLGPRIMIRGEPLHLQNPDNAARIRTALLSGIRAAVLWRQAGGSKFGLLLRRRSLAVTARELVDKTGR
ncbi:MAG: high frequency lysogenization protein HflD [Gammaproteobacteria bacterium]|nr:high frequency lysogenization protein HflD [Gammaproteobacteria bacterium]